jgi:hypothetical protein
MLRDQIVTRILEQPILNHTTTRHNDIRPLSCYQFFLFQVMQNLNDLEGLKCATRVMRLEVLPHLTVQP